MNMDHFERQVDPATGWGTEEPTEQTPMEAPAEGEVFVECPHGNRIEFRFVGARATVDIARVAFECGCSIEPAPQHSPSWWERLLWRLGRTPPIA